MKTTQEILISLVLMLGMIGAVSAATIHVPKDFDTIQEAIDAAISGDKIKVAAGTYTADGGALAVIDKPLTLTGKGRIATILDGGAYGSGSDTSSIGNGWTRAIVIQSSDVTIQNLKITNFQGNQTTAGGYGIVARADSSWAVGGDTTYSGLVIKNVTFDDVYYGISLNRTDGTAIKGIKYEVTSGSPDYAVYATLSPNAVIENNTINQGSIWLTNQSHNGEIRNNHITDAPYNGIWFGMQFAPGTSSQNVLIENNTIDGAYEGGIVVGNMAYESSGHVQIINNRVNGAGDLWGEHHGGISIIGGTFPNLIIQGNTVENNVYGLSLHTEWGGPWGETRIDNATIVNNSFTGNDESGIFVNANSGLEILIGDVDVTNNNIYENGDGIVNNATNAGTIDAQNNYWGDVTGPGGVGPGSGDSVSYLVDYDPWLSKEAKGKKK